MCTSIDIFKSRITIVKFEQYCESENNKIMQNYLTQNLDDRNLPPWFLSFELFNKNLNKIFQIRKGQEIGYFMIVNHAGKEIRHSFKKER